MQLQNQKMFLLLIILVLISNNLFAQGDYYNGTDGLNGSSLKSTLHDKIKGHTEKSYTFLRTLLSESDRDPNNSSNIILIYTDYSVQASDGAAWNREHVWAKSHGGFDNDPPAGTDAHHIRPADYDANSTRGNKDFDYGGSQTYEKDVHYDDDSWEPRDEIKGDVARMMLYMTVRYEGEEGYDLELVDYTGTSGPNFGKKSVLLEWNRLDPISAFERNRNRVIYKHQKNYNPFVDHPEYADRIYNSDKLFIEKAEQVGNNLILSFSKELNSTEAEKVGNYEVYEFGNPITAESNFAGDTRKVALTFSESFVDTFYNVRVSNLLSASGEAIIPNSIALFLADETTETDTLAPSAPTDLIASSAGGEINLNWTSNSEPDISHYAIYRGVIKNFTPSIHTLLTTVTSNTFTDTEVFDYKVYYRISAFDKSGNESDYSNEASILVGVDDEETTPKQFSLSQNYPNPFNPSTVIRYEIGDLRFVTLKVYNVLGKEIATLVNKIQSSGNYEVKFNSSELSSGIYFYTLSSGDYIKTQKMTILK